MAWLGVSSEPGVDVAAVDCFVCKLASQALTARAKSRGSRESAVWHAASEHLHLKAVH